jgi:hypothetical protein
MRSFIFALLALLALSPAYAAERRYSVTDFDRIQVDGAFDVRLTTGKSSSAVATGSPAALDRVAIDVQGRTLRIRPNPSAWGSSPSNQDTPVTIALTTQALRAATVNGAGLLSIDRLRGLRADVGIAGSGRIAVSSAEVDSLFLNMLGSGKMQVAGKAKSLRAEVRGSGDLEAQGLTAADAQIFADTAGSITLQASRSANVVATGAGDVNVAGAAACTVKRQGIGRVLCGKS